MSAPHNLDRQELSRFARLARDWWDPDGPLRTLHAINPLRLDYIDRRVRLAGKRVLDVGCGGGILSEAMARRGATVTGIDPGEEAVGAARVHAEGGALSVNYRALTAEALAAEHPGAYDVVTCMELLEHVPDPASTVRACAELVRPHGHVFFATLNRTPKAYVLAVLGAEYLLGLLPRGTHDYAKFIRPSELEAWSRAAGLRVHELCGVAYNPLTRRCRLSDDVTVNYMAWARAGNDADRDR